MFIMFKTTTISNQFCSREFQEHTLGEENFIVVKFGQLLIIHESPQTVTRFHLAKFRDVNPLQFVAITLEQSNLVNDCNGTRTYTQIFKTGESFLQDFEIVTCYPSTPPKYFAPRSFVRN